MAKDENILNSLRDHGVLSESAQQKLLNILPNGAKEKLSNIFQRYQELNDEEKQEFMNEAFDKFKQSLHDKVYNNSTYMQLFSSHSYIVFVFAVLFVVLVLAFFLYKLFKILMERETKREEKKKMKQMKKKK